MKSCFALLILISFGARAARAPLLLFREPLTRAGALPVFLRFRGDVRATAGGLLTSARPAWARSGIEVGPAPLGKQPLEIEYEFRPQTFAFQCQEFASQTPSTHWYMVFADGHGVLRCYLRRHGAWRVRASAPGRLETGRWYRARVRITRSSFSFQLEDSASGRQVWDSGRLSMDDPGASTTFILCDEAPAAVARATLWRNLRVGASDPILVKRWQAGISVLEDRRRERLRRRRMLEAMEKAGIRLIPTPQRVRIDRGVFRLLQKPGCVCEGAMAETTGLEAVRRAFSERLPGRCELRKRRAGRLHLIQVAPDSNRPERSAQGYSLDVSKERIRIEAVSARGFFYAAQTLAQLVRPDRTTPCVRIRDWPAIPERLVMVAVSQGGFQVIDIPYWKRMIRELAAVKITMIMPYFEGGTFYYQKYPFLAAKGRDGFTIQKGRILSAYARKHFIRIVPQQESLGHSGFMLSHPQLRALREGGGTFCASRPAVFAFLGNLYDDLVKAFPDAPYIHVGGDEFDSHFGICPACKARVAKIGRDGLYAEYLMRLRTMLARRGRGMMIWRHEHGFTESAAARLAKDIVVFDWHYGNQAAYPTLKRLQDLGFSQTWATPAITRYYNGTDDWDNTFGNLRGFLTAGAERRVPGCCVCTWVHGLWGGRNLFELNYYGLTYAAACAWNPLAAAPAAFQAAWPVLWFGIEAPVPAVRAAVHAPFGPAGKQGFWRNNRALEPIIAESVAATVERVRKTPELVSQARALLDYCRNARRVLDAWREKAARNRVTLDFFEHDVHLHETAARRILLARAVIAGDRAEQTRLAAGLARDYDRIIAMFKRSIREAGGGDCAWTGLSRGHIRFRARQGRDYLRRFRDALGQHSPAKP